MAKGVWVAFKDNKIIGFVLTEAEAQARVRCGQADHFIWHEFATSKHGTEAIIPYLTIKEEE